MNHVWTVVMRPAGFCARSSPWKRDQPAIQGAISWLFRSSYKRSFFSIDCSKQTSRKQIDGIPRAPRLFAPSTPSQRRTIHNSPILCKLKPYTGPKYEQGLKFQAENLTSKQLEGVFGFELENAHFGNRLLRVLYGRMVDGTLDLPPPEDVEQELAQYPEETVPLAIQWLQENFPVDEEEAIQRRIEREEAASEQQSPAQLMQRAEDLGLYKPQSGLYYAPLSEKEGDVFGKSELDRIREERIAEAEKEEAELDKQIEELQAQVIHEQTNTTLTKAPEQGVEVAQDGNRPPNTYERWVLKQRNRATSQLTLESPEIVNMTKMQRLLPSFLFVAVVSLLSYAFSQTWIPPKRSERIMQDTSISFATVAGIFAINMLIYTLWKFPPCWRMLNRYFITVPGQPRAASMLGNVFSHQSLYHLVLNIAWMFFLGLSLHEDVGRGTFLGVYCAGGAISSFASMTNFVARGNLMTSSIGASGAVSAVISMYCAIHAQDKFTLGFLPKEWQEKVQFQGWMFLSLMLATQFLGFFRPLKTVDYASHLAGYAVGGVCGWWWRTNREIDGTWKKGSQKQQQTSFDRLFARQDGQGGIDEMDQQT